MRLLLAATLVLVIALSIPPVVSAARPQPTDLDTFAAANSLYEAGNYDEAARIYQHLVELGYEDATLYYNLGNAYYKNDDVGRAVLNYMRARSMAPYDQDIQTNLALARQEIESPVVRDAPLPMIVEFAELLPWVSFDLAAGLALACWIVLVSTGAACIWSARVRASILARRVAIATVIGLAAFGSLAVGHQLSRQHWETVAVITVGTTEVHAGPSSRYPSKFKLNSGHEVRLAESRGGWSKVAIPTTDLRGWVPSANIELVRFR